MSKTKPKVDDLSDIFGDDKKGTKMASKKTVDAAVAASKAKHTSKANGSTKPAKAVPAKAAPAKEKAQRGGTGKFYFPAGKERDALKAKVGSIKKAISTTELAKVLKVDTFKVRLVSVELANEKRIKRVKDGNSYTLSPK